ncbi:hypothetical protein BGX28_009526 [Mortierella sp. GBA30]|nr:hypothetical protein BGX28_009526 [Mortierella sp. GBA30]
MCGSSFPASCGLQQNSLYQCNGTGLPPNSTSLETCQNGCTVSYPNSHCEITCSTSASSIVSLIDQAIVTIDSSLRTSVLLQPFVDAFNAIRGNLTSTTGSTDALRTITGTVDFTISSLYVILSNNQPLFPDASDGNAYNVLVGIFQEDNGLLSLSGQLIDCAGFTSAQCDAADALFHSYVNMAINRANDGTFGDDPVALANLASDIVTFQTEIDIAISTRNVTMLAETGTTMNEIIGRILGNPAVYADMWDYAILVYESAKEYLECKGFDATAFTTSCAQTSDRIFGAVYDFVPFFQARLGTLPIIGPIVGATVVNEFQQLQVLAQQDSIAADCEAASLFNATLALVNSEIPSTTQNLIREYLIRLYGVGANTGFLDLEPDCGCTGAIRCIAGPRLIRIVANNTLNTIQGLAATGSQINIMETPLINQLLSDLNSTSTTLLQADYAALQGSIPTVQGVPGWSLTPTHLFLKARLQMEILRDNFQRELPYIKEAIKECEFIAIDAEFSGLHTEPNKRTQQTTLEESYEELRKSATQFLTVQIGITTFTFDPRNGTYLAKPFNFFIFPTTAAGYAPQGRCFLTEASSLDFLAKNRFDFNKWVYHGVHYMTKAEEEIYKKERTKLANNEFETISVDAVNAKWIADVIESIKAWKVNGSAMNFINIQTNNAYQRRLVYQEVRRLWPTELNARGQAGHINITKTTERQLEIQHQQRQADLQRDVENSIGFRAVVDTLSACGKPIVGHNIVVDLAYILAQFVGPLPPTMEEYKRMIHRTFPTVMDTKYVSYTAAALRGMSYDSSLGGLENLVGSVQFMGCPSIVPHYRHQKYMSSDLAHEAGYDSYITGSIMIRMLAFIARNELPAQVVGQTEVMEKKPLQDKREKKNISKKRKNGPIKSPVTPTISTPKSPAKQTDTPSAPKKVSYAEMLNRKKDALQSTPIIVAQPQAQLQAAGKSSACPVDAKVTRGTPSELGLAHEPESDVLEESDEDSDREVVAQLEMEAFEKPFSFQSPSLKCYQNILHWGRSSHGCINLTSS